MIRGRMKSWLRLKAMMGEGDRGNPLTCPSPPRGELSTRPELPQSPEDVQLPGVPSHVGCSAMSDRGVGATEAVVPFAPKPTPSPKLAIHLTGQPRLFWGCFTGPLLMPRQITSKL